MTNFATRLKTFLLCSLLLAAACNIHSTDNSRTSNSGSASPAAAEANPIDAMTASIKAQFDAKSYRARMESLADGRSFTTTVEYVAPDRFHMVTPGNETIIVGSNTYVKLPTGQWQKIPVNANEMISSFRDPKLVEDLRNSTDVKFLGTDSIDGTPVKIYQYTVKNAFGSNVTTTSKVWIAASDNLPRKMEVEGEANGKASKTLVTYYDYNTDIKIEPPM